jgi:hypothetical protein
LFAPDASTSQYDRKHPSTATLELQATFVDAVNDEAARDLPLLFRVDEEVRWPGGLTYRSACTDGPCQPLDADGRICVHVARGYSWTADDPPAGDTWTP